MAKKYKKVKFKVKFTKKSPLKPRYLSGSQKNPLRIFGMGVAILICTASFIVNAWVNYYWSNKTTSTQTTTYVDSLTYVADDTYFIEANYFSNELNNGEEIFEVRFNYYTDSTIPQTLDELKNVYSSGVQFVGNPKFSTNNHFEEYLKNEILHKIKSYSQRTKYSDNHYYFNTTGNDISYAAISDLPNRDKWIVDFDGLIGRVVQKGYRPEKQYLVKNLKDEYSWLEHKEEWLYQYNDVNRFLSKLYNSVKNGPNGYNVLQFDLSQYFEGEYVDTALNQYDSTAKADINDMFMNIKVNRSPNGMVTHTQSIFGGVGIKKYKNGEVDVDYNWVHPSYQEAEDYWQTNSIVKLSYKDFDFLQVGNQHYGKIKEEASNFLSAFNNIEIVITIDIDVAALDGINFFGFREDPFTGLKPHTIIFKSTSQVNFDLPTALDTSIKINTVNVTLTVTEV